METKTKKHENPEQKKEKRLEYLKFRYQKLILDPRKQTESEIDKCFSEEFES